MSTRWNENEGKVHAQKPSDGPKKQRFARATCRGDFIWHLADIILSFCCTFSLANC